MRTSRLVIVGLLAALALSGCGDSTTPSAPDAGPDQDASARNVQLNVTFAAPPGIAVTYDEALVPVGARAGVTSKEDAGSTTVMLDVSGLQPDRQYGSHAHTMPCGADGQAAGPHFQHEQDPVSPSVDPAFANAVNEIWLDFTTDPSGASMVTSTVPWTFTDDRRAKSVIIHAMQTATEPGRAGDAGGRIACISVDF
ncbi:MAG: superoxide dismutase family protein [Pseudonocardia sp.]